MSASNVDPLPLRQGAGKRNQDLFLLGSKSSPICFYFEDEGSEELYSRFLKRLFPSYTKPLVICTGGKTKKTVLADADAHKLTPILFVQDKDFDDLIGSISTDPRIVTLHRYSFENYLLEKDALVELAIESKRRLSREDAIQTLAIEEYLASLSESYRPLAELFVTVRKLNLKSVKTTKQPIADLVAPGSVLVGDSDVGKFRSEVLKTALASQRIGTEKDLQPLLDIALTAKPQYSQHADGDPNSHFCGKHLLDLVLLYVDGKVGTALSKVDRFEIAMRLLLHISMAIFSRVRADIQSSLSIQGASTETRALFA